MPLLIYNKKLIVEQMSLQTILFHNHDWRGYFDK